MTFGHDQSRDCSGSNSRGDGITPLVCVDLSMPTAPDPSWGKHASSTAHVTEGSLARPVGSTTTDTRDTGHSTTSSPGLSRCLVTCFLRYSIWLAGVFEHLEMHSIYNVWPDWSLENSRQSDGGSCLPLRTMYGNKRTSCHLESCYCDFSSPRRYVKGRGKGCCGSSTGMYNI